MKKLFLAVLAAILLSGATAQEAFPDIPEGHWAGDAVSRIADLGIVIGFPDGTFRGNEGFTRYQMALVISRMLDVVNADIGALRALHESDIASLRNALQELASDVAAQGVRLNAVEGAVASISDDVASNTARLDALEGMDMGGLDPAVLQDLQNQIAAARVAADTAGAQAEAAAAAAAAAGDLAAAADARSRQNADAISAINDLLTLLNEDIANMGGMEMEMQDISGIERNASDIANIREFVILLRRDQVALRDRVAALEAADADQTAAIEDLTSRVGILEDQAVVISGSIGLSYKVGRLSGTETPFDSDRVWGLNNERDIGTSIFSSGTSDLNDDGDVTDDGEEVQDRVDIEDKEGEVDPTLTISVLANRTGGGVGSPRALNSFDSVLELALTEVDNLDKDLGDGTDFINGYVFTIKSWTTTFDPIGGAPLTFQFGEKPSAVFTDYVFQSGIGESEGDGFVATLGSPDFLAFLNPTLVVAYGEVDGTIEYNDGDDVTGDVYPDTYYRGIRGTLTPLSGDTLSATGGFSYAQVTTNAGENADAAGDNETVTVYGVDGQIGVSILDLAFEYASSSGTFTVDNGTRNADNELVTETRGSDSTLFYVTADVDVASLGLPIIRSLNANYRSIPVAWDGLRNSADYPFSLDQVGFKVEAGLGLFILDPLSVYFDSYSNAAGNSVSAFGVDAKFNIFRAFSITGFYHNASIDGALVNNVSDGETAEETAPVTGLDRETNYDTAFGVRLAHDGGADNALIPNLNLTVEYKQSEADFSKTTIDVNADYTLNVSILELTPYVGYTSEVDADTPTDDTNTIKAGTGFKTEALGIFLQPSLEGSVNYRTTTHSDAEAYTASELQYAIGLSFGQFLFDNSTLRVRYGSWSGTNINNANAEAGIGADGDFATDISGGDLDGTGDQSTSGYEVQWDYWDLQFGYGAYTNNNAGAVGAAQSFKISYTVTF